MNMFVLKMELIGVFAGFGIFYAVLDILFYVKYTHLLKTKTE
jgi:hypothetical protein